MKKVVPSLFPSPEMLDPVGFGQAVRAARTKALMTIEETSMMIGVAKQTLQDLEKGTGTVSLGLSMKIATQLGVTIFAVQRKDRVCVIQALKNDDAFDEPDHPSRLGDRP